MASSKRLLLPSLPLELVEEILHRTPIKSVVRFKWTCTKWLDLITSKNFVYNHLKHQSLEQFIRIERINDDHQRVYIMDPVTGLYSVSSIPYEYHNNRRGPVQIASMVHCDGLILCMCQGYGQSGYAFLAIWNPFLRKFKWIEPKPKDAYWMSDEFGIGYEPCDDTVPHDNYKVLRVSGYWFHCHESNPMRLVYKNSKYEIYEFKSDSWRPLGVKFDWDVNLECRGTSVMGNMYWISGNDEGTSRKIISFDFGTETFKDICVSPSSTSRVHQLACFNGDRLSVLLQGEASEDIEVWVTNKLSDGVVSFSQYFNVTSCPDLPTIRIYNCVASPGYFIGEHRNIMVWCEEDVDIDEEQYISINFYEIGEGGIIRRIETGRQERVRPGYPIFGSYVYIPSLIPIPVPE